MQILFGLAVLAVQCSGFIAMRGPIVAPRELTRLEESRRGFVGGGVRAAGVAATAILAPPASAVVYLDPARYGDQELKKSAITRVRTSVRAAILAKPTLAPAFLKLALLDALSFNLKTGQGGPDGTVLATVLALPSGSEWDPLQECARVLINAEGTLKRTNALTFADLVALAGAEAIESVGGPAMLVQLGRTDADRLAEVLKRGAKDKPAAPAFDIANPTGAAAQKAFKRSGLTDREAVLLLSAVLTLERVDKTSLTGARGQAQERGKMVRSQGGEKRKRLPGGNGAPPEGVDDDDDEDAFSGDLKMGSDFQIVDSFGTREEAFGQRIQTEGAIIFIAPLKALAKNGYKSSTWEEEVLVASPPSQAAVAKYASQSLLFQKDLVKTYDRLTQLGAEYTGGKYQALLEGRSKPKLNDI